MGTKAIAKALDAEHILPPRSPHGVTAPCVAYLSGKVSRDGRITSGRPHQHHSRRSTATANILPSNDGTVVSVNVNTERAQVDWDVPSTLVLQLDVDQFGIQLCSGYGPPDEDGEMSSLTETDDQDGIL